MSLKRSLVLGLLCLAASSLQAQRVFVMPANPGTTPQTAVFTSEPFAGLTTFFGAPSPFTVLANADASKYYAVSKSANDTVVVLNNQFGVTVSNRFNYGVGAEAAGMSPDGRRLVVLAGTVHIIDTATDQEVANITLPSAVQAVDLAFTPDSTRVAILTRSTLGTILNSPVYVLDLNAPQSNPSSNFTAAGLNTTIAAAPTGYFYVTAQNRIYELDRNGNLRNEIQLNAFPSKLTFTPSGLTAVAGNLSPVTGSQMLVVNLVDRTVLPVTFGNFPSVTFDKIVLLGTTRGVAYSPTTQRLYDINFANLTASEASFGSSTAIQNVRALAASNEYPVPRYLFIGTETGVARVDVANNLISNPLPLASAPLSGTGLAFASPASTSPVSQLFAFNNNQSAAGGTQYVPLVVRAVDATGQPVSGAIVNFTSNAPTAVLAPAAATTNASGYAQTIVTAPAAVGDFNVTANVGTVSQQFNLRVTSASTGGGNTGGGTGSSGGLTIVSGNGQGVRENFQSAELLGVQVKDNNGNPVPNATITFTITSGTGTLQPAGITGTLGVCASAGTTVSCTTDSNGQAGVSFLASPIPAGFSYQAATVSATYNNNAVNFTLVTYVNALPNGGLSPDPSVVIIKPTAEDRTIVAKAGSTVAGAIIAQVIVAGGPQTGQGIPNVGIRATTGFTPEQGPSAFCNGPGNVALTDSGGTATCDLVVGGRLGTAQLNVNVGAFNNQAPLTLTVLPGDPGRITIQRGNNQSGLPGAQLPEALVAVITDAFGNPLPGVRATFTVVNPGTVTLRNVFDVSDAQGRVSALATLGGTPGPQQVRVSVGSISQTFTLTVNAAFGGVTQVSGGGQNVEINQPFSQPLVVSVTDTQGRPLPGATVAFNVTSGSATLSASTATTNANGQASVTVRAGANPGPITVTATAGSFTTAFNLTSRLPGPQLTAAGFVNGASFERGVVPGGIVTIYGTGIAPGIVGSVVPPSMVGPLPTTLAGVEVSFNGVAAPIYAVTNQDGRESVTVQVPFETAPGQAEVRVNVSGGASTITVPVSAVQPGIFESFVGSQRYAVAVRPDGSFVSPNNPARRGETIRIFATGLGQVTAATATNRAGVPNQRVNANLILGINYEGVGITSATYAEGLVGLYVITFQVPSTAPAGSAIPLNMAAIGPDGQPSYSKDSFIAIQ